MTPYRVGLRARCGAPDALGLWCGPNGSAMLAGPRGPDLHAPDPDNPE